MINELLPYIMPLRLSKVNVTTITHVGLVTMGAECTSLILIMRDSMNCQWWTGNVYHEYIILEVYWSTRKIHNNICASYCLLSKNVHLQNIDLCLLVADGLIKGTFRHDDGSCRKSDGTLRRRSRHSGWCEVNNGVRPSVMRGEKRDGPLARLSLNDQTG